MATMRSICVPCTAGIPGSAGSTIVVGEACDLAADGGALAIDSGTGGAADVGAIGIGVGVGLCVLCAYTGTISVTPSNNNPGSTSLWQLSLRMLPCCAPRLVIARSSAQC